MKRPNIVQASRVGARERNEDRVAHWNAPEAVLLAVADGLGGHLHGELAAQMAIDALGEGFEREARPKLADPSRFLAATLRSTHAAIVNEARVRDLHDNPRTVVAACVVQDAHAYWTHVGDCRFYLLREGQVLARSRDHTVVQRMIDEGRLREDAAGTHPYRNRLLQCLGGFQDPTIERAAVQLARGDLLLLCSDGFWGPLDPREMTQALLARPLAEAIPELVERAENSAGADCDNISVVAMVWDS